MNVQFFQRCRAYHVAALAAVIKISFFTAICSIFFIQSVNAESVPPELQGSGLPLPRYVSIGSNEVFVRSGPAQRYPVKWVYTRKGMPVEITQEFDVWRKVKDMNGDEGWINKALLSDRRHVVIQGQDEVPVYEKDDSGSRLVAKFEPGVVARVEECATGWCKLSAGGFAGWVERNILWGIYPQEEIH